MENNNIKIEYIIEPLSVWKDRENGATILVVLAISKDKKYIIVSGTIDEVSPMFHIDYFISKYEPSKDF